MGFAVRIRIKERQVAGVQAASREILDWADSIGGYEKAYLEWIQQPENSGKTRLQFLGEKARAGAEGKQEAKPLTDEEVRRITRYSRKEKAGTINDVERKELKRLKGKQGGGTTEPSAYQLPDKTGKMVAVDKKTFDDYQTYWGKQ